MSLQRSASSSRNQNTAEHNVGIEKSIFEDDDGRIRTGTMWTTTAHIITAVIGSGVLSLAWSLAQLGWVGGVIVLVAFSMITFYTSFFLADCNRAPVTGKRGRNYTEVVRAHLGETSVKLCALAQYTNFVGVTIGYTITASISMVAVQRSNCFHKYGHNVRCRANNYPFMIAFGCLQIVLSQIPNFHELSWLSVVAAVMSFAYSGIGVGLSLAKVAGGGPKPRTSMTGTTVGVDVTSEEKMWKVFQALGNIAFAYNFLNILVEIQDTLKPNPPDTKEMKKASVIGISTTSIFYLLCGTLGYAAFGNNAPGNFLTGFGFYEPFWLIDFANVCIAVHLVGAYQVYAQPIFSTVEQKCEKWWPASSFINESHNVLGFHVNLFKLVWRTIYVIFTSLIATIFPFFNDICGLLGATAYYPLAVYFPIEMHISQNKIQKFSPKWMWLKTLSTILFVVAVVSAVGCVQGIVQSLRIYKVFGSVG